MSNQGPPLVFMSFCIHELFYHAVIYLRYFFIELCRHLVLIAIALYKAEIYSKCKVIIDYYSKVLIWVLFARSDDEKGHISYHFDLLLNIILCFSIFL